MVLPELPLAVGDGAFVSSALLLGVCFAVPFVSGVLALVVLPEFAAAVGLFAGGSAAGLEAPAVSAFADFDLRLLAAVVFFSAVVFSPAGAAAVVVESALLLFFDLFSAVAVELSLFPASAVFVLDLLLLAAVSAAESVPAASVESAFFFDLPVAFEVFAAASVPVALESVFFFALVFLAVVELSPALAFGVAVDSLGSAAAFFFFFAFAFAAAVESVCAWSLDCLAAPACAGTPAAPTRSAKIAK